MAKIKVRSPKTRRERLLAALLSTDDDLLPDNNFRILVTGKLPTGEIIELGSFSAALLHDKNTDIHEIIDRIRFGAQ